MSARLRGERLNLGLTQRQAAEQIGVDWKTLQRAENGESVPHPANAKTIADFYGVKVTDLWPVVEQAA